jgi:Leucine-rich repeat (LRR) protein
MDSLPAAITVLYQLQELHLEQCPGLSGLPDGSLQHLTTLTSLSLYGCDCVEDLPAGISSLTSLQNLDLSDTKVTKCPEGIAQLSSSLTYLSLADTHMSCGASCKQVQAHGSV